MQLSDHIDPSREFVSKSSQLVNVGNQRSMTARLVESVIPVRFVNRQEYA